MFSGFLFLGFRPDRPKREAEGKKKKMRRREEKKKVEEEEEEEEALMTNLVLYCHESYITGFSYFSTLFDIEKERRKLDIIDIRDGDDEEEDDDEKEEKTAVLKGERKKKPEEEV